MYTHKLTDWNMNRFGFSYNFGVVRIHERIVFVANIIISPLSVFAKDQHSGP